MLLIIDIELTANNTITHASVKFIKPYIFLLRTHHSLLALRNTKHHFSILLEGHHKQCITNTQDKNAENWVLYKSYINWLTVWDLRQEGSMSACSASAGHVHLDNPKLLVTYAHLQTAIKLLPILISTLQISFSKLVDSPVGNL